MSEKELRTLLEIRSNQPWPGQEDETCGSTPRRHVFEKASLSLTDASGTSQEPRASTSTDSSKTSGPSDAETDNDENSQRTPYSVGSRCVCPAGIAALLVILANSLFPFNHHVMVAKK